MTFVRCSLAVALAAFSLSLPAAPARSLAEASAMFDQMDREEMLEALDQATACVSQREFNCSSRELDKAKSLINNDSDRKLWQLVANSHSEEQRLAREEREAIERAEREEQEWEREQERREQRRAERDAEKWQQAYAMTHVVLAAQTYLTPQQREAMARAAGDDAVSGGNANLSAVGDSINRDLSAELHRKQEQLQRQREFQSRQRDAQQREIAQQREQAAQAARQARQQAQAEQRIVMASAPGTPTLPSSAQSETTAQREAQARKAAEERAAQATERTRQAAEARAQQEAASAKLAAEEQARKEAREQERAKAKAEEAARKLAEKEAAAQAKVNYLSQVTQQTRMGAMNCYGEYHVGSNRPRIKPEVVSCIDIRFRASCPDGRNFVEGVASNVVGMGTGCFGDTTQIQKLACDAKDLRVQALETRECGGFK